MLRARRSPRVDDLRGDVLRLAVGHVEQLHAGKFAHPRLLTFGEAPGRGDGGVDVAGEQFAIAHGRGGRRTDASGCGSAYFLDRAGPHHRRHPLRGSLPEPVAIHRQPKQQRRHAQVIGPQLVGLRAALGKRSAGGEQLVRPHHAGGVARLDEGGSCRVAGDELGMQGGEPVRRARAVKQRFANARLRRRREVKLGDRRAQVEPGTANEDRRLPGRSRLIDQRVRARSVLRDVPRLRHRQETNEFMRQRCLFCGAGLRREQRQFAVHLQSVGADRHRLDAALAQERASGDGNHGLSDRRRTEDRKQGCRHDRSIPPGAGVWCSVGAMQLQGAKVLLTGATGGLGEAIARKLAGEGARLVLSGRKVDVLEALASELDAVVAPCDVTDRAALDALLDEHGDADILIANAAVPATGEIDSFSAEQLDRVIEANLTAPIQMARYIVPKMRERGSGHIVFMASLAGRSASPASSMYNATKFGLRGFAFGLAQDLEPHGIGVSVVSPGFIRDAGMFARSGAEDSLPPGVGTATPHDVANAVVDAIRKGRLEKMVAPLPMKVGAAFGEALPAVAAKVQKASGAHKIAAKLADGQVTYRT